MTSPLALELNQQIQENAPGSFELLSKVGKKMFFPKGILSQSAEAKSKANKFNATIGIATELGQPMHLSVKKKFFNNLEPSEIYPYAPPAGRPKLRELWKERTLKNNPTQRDKHFSNPVVTNALTHGLSVIAKLFIDEDDVIITPDKIWGNYKLIFETEVGGKIEDFPLFNNEGKFNCAAFRNVLRKQGEAKGKVMLLLNFPNNPTGYTPGIEEAQEIIQIVKEEAERGTKILTVSDDAYFGLFFENSIKESLFGYFANLHENILAVKIDGATKENFAWGFRTGFVTLATKTENPASVYEALEKKVMGQIRAGISNCPHVSQSVIEKILQEPEFESQTREKFEILKNRVVTLKKILEKEAYQDYWNIYPFNSGYFMCLELKQGIDAEVLRVQLLDEYGVGTIALGKTDLRVAFSCIEEEQLEELFDLILAGCKDLVK